jgi:hypothetical protein
MKAQTVDLVSHAFLNNPRIKSFVGGDSSSIQKVRPIIEYAYDIAHRLDGIYHSSNKKAVIFYYQKSKFTKTWKDRLNYLKVIIKSIGLDRTMPIYFREKKVQDIRAKEEDYIYVWFLAQEANYNKLDGLLELNAHLIEKSQALKLPILIETTDKRNIVMYQRIGFEIYNTWKDEENDLTVWYMRRNVSL